MSYKANSRVIFIIFVTFVTQIIQGPKNNDDILIQVFILVKASGLERPLLTFSAKMAEAFKWFLFLLTF